MTTNFSRSGNSPPLLKTSLAAVRYLTAEPDRRDREMRSLERICKTALKAKKLYLAGDDSHVDEVTHEWTSEEIEWIQLFIVNFFAPYLPVVNGVAVALSREQALALARQDKFRYIGRVCCQDLIDELRHRQRMSNTVDAVEDGEFIRVPPTMVSEHEASVEPEFANRSSLGIRSVELDEVLARNRTELRKLLGPKLFPVLEAQCAMLESKGDVRREVERRLNVKAKMATTYIGRLQVAMAKALGEQNLAAREIYTALVDAAKRVVPVSAIRTNEGDEDEEDTFDIVYYKKPKPGDEVLRGAAFTEVENV